jgi:hypothetical protein
MRLLFSGKWMEMDIFMLNEMGQNQKEIPNIFFHIQKLDLKTDKQTNTQT